MSQPSKSPQQLAEVLYYLRSGLNASAISACDASLADPAETNLMQFWKAFAIAKQGDIIQAQKILYSLTSQPDVQLPACLLIRDISTPDRSSLLSTSCLFICASF